MAPLEERLTAREREVMRLRGEGLCVEEIAHRLGISEHTARKHRDNAVKQSGTGDQLLTILQLQGRDTASA